MKLIERTNCPVCSNQKYKLLYKISYKDNKMLKFLNNYYQNKIPVQLLTNFEYQLAECNKCNLIFQKFVPDNEFSYMLYEKIISSKKSLDKKLQSKNSDHKKYDNEIKLIKNIFKKDKIKVLEFGAGWGFWASRAIESGLNVDAFELSESRVNYMKEKGINVIEDLKNSFVKYDLIYSDQTIEHISDPHQIFKTFLPNLKQDGYILLNYPSSFNFKKQLNKFYVPNKDVAHPLEHLNIFNRNSLRYLINEYDLKIIYFKSKFNPSIKNFLKDIKNLIYFNNILIKKKKIKLF